MAKEKRSFFERLTGTVSLEDEEFREEEEGRPHPHQQAHQGEEHGEQHGEHDDERVNEVSEERGHEQIGN